MFSGRHINPPSHLLLKSHEIRLANIEIKQSLIFCLLLWCLLSNLYLSLISCVIGASAIHVHFPLLSLDFLGGFGIGGH